MPSPRTRLRLLALAATIGCTHAGGPPKGPGSTDTGGAGGEDQTPRPPDAAAGRGGAPARSDAGSTGGTGEDAASPSPDSAGPSPDSAGRSPDASVTAFVHPGLLSTKAEFDFMKQQVAAGREPWRTAFEKLKASPAGSLGYQPRPVAQVACGSGGQPDLGCSDETRDSQAVYAHALLWAASGDVRHAQKCAEILDAWSAVLKSHGMSNAPLQIGWTGGGFVRAAEILRYTYPQWGKASIDRFSAMMNGAEKIVNTHSPEGAVQHMMWGTLSHHGVGLVE